MNTACGKYNKYNYFLNRSVAENNYVSINEDIFKI